MRTYWRGVGGRGGQGHELMPRLVSGPNLRFCPPLHIPPTHLQGASNTVDGPSASAVITGAVQGMAFQGGGAWGAGGRLLVACTHRSTSMTLQEQAASSILIANCQPRCLPFTRRPVLDRVDRQRVRVGLLELHPPPEPRLGRRHGQHGRRLVRPRLAPAAHRGRPSRCVASCLFVYMY
jgi:hypothetical protein